MGLCVRVRSHFFLFQEDEEGEDEEGEEDDGEEGEEEDGEEEGEGDE